MSNSLPLATPRNWRQRENYDPEDRYWNGHGHGRVPISLLPYPRQEEGEHTYTPWTLFEERVRTGPYGLHRFPLRPYSPVRILIFDGTGNSSTVNPRLRQFIQNSPPRIRGEWLPRQELPEAAEEPVLTQDEFNKAMKKLRKQLYNPTNPRRRAWRRGLFFSNRGGNNNSNNNGMADEEGISSESKECAICLEAFVLNDQVLVTPCNHMFHHDCLVPWVKSRGQCPVCRLMLYETRRAVSSPYDSNNDNSVDRSRRSSSTANGVRVANDEEMALDLIYLIRAMEEAFNWINLSR